MIVSGSPGRWTSNLNEKYSETDGTVTIEFIGDSSGFLGQKNILVPAQNSVTDLMELDITMNDNSVTYRILNQRKV